VNGSENNANLVGKEEEGKKGKIIHSYI